MIMDLKGWLVSTGIICILVGMAFVFLAKDISLFYRILMAILFLIISLAGMAYRWWYLNKDEIEDDKENSFKEILNTIDKDKDK
jgi:hypothetical protein